MAARVWVQSRLRDRDPLTVLRLVTEFERWPDASEQVLSVRVEKQPDGSELSHWEVVFREGVLRWTEHDWLDLDAGRGRFDLVEGDLLVFRGTWTSEARDSACVLTFEADFDLGMPSLGHVLDPIAVEAVEEAIETVLQGLFGPDFEIKFTDAAPDAVPEGEEASV